MLILTGLVIWTLLSTSAFAQNEVNLTNGEWPPYTSETLKYNGVFSHIVSEAFSLAGYEVKYHFFPWKRSYRAAKLAEFDGSVAWAPTAERRKDFYFSDPVIYSRKVFFHMKSHPFDYSKISDLEQKRIGATSNYTYGKDFDYAAKLDTIKVEYVTKDVQNIRKLLRDRIDIFPMEIQVGYSLIHSELPADQAALITNHPLPVMDTPINVAISRQIPKERAEKLLKGLNQGLKQLKKNGRFDELIWHSRKGYYKQ